MNSADRWPSIEALLQELGRDPGAKRRAWLSAFGLAAVASLGAFGFARASAGQAVCDGGAGKLAEVWNDGERATIKAAFLGVETPFAEDSWIRVERRVDEYAADWINMHRDACEATAIRKEQSQALLDLRMGCLEDRLRGLQALTSVLHHADATAVEKSVAAVAALPSIARCGDRDALTALVAPPEDPAIAAAVTELHGRLAQAHALESAGKIQEGFALSQALATDADALAYRPISAAAHLQLGRLAQQAGEYEAARDNLTQAYWDAEATRQDELKAEAASVLVTVVGKDLAKLDRGRLWAEHGRASIDRIGAPESHTARLLVGIAELHFVEGDFAAAERELRHVLELRERTLGADHPDLASTLSRLGEMCFRQANYDDALTFSERAVEVTTQALGPEHPAVGSALAQLGQVYQYNRKLEKARPYLERSLEIAEHAVGKRHPDYAKGLLRMGEFYRMSGDYDAAQTVLDQTVALLQARLGRDHPDTANAIGRLAIVHHMKGDVEEAKAGYRETIEIIEKAMGPDHISLVDNLSNLGILHRSLDEVEEATAYYERAMKIRESKLGAGHPEIALIHVNIGNLFLDRGDVEEAEKRFLLALEMFEEK
ncbi:MAG TPA: tetratricopeptide repeat protein, partial [Nannocystis exedens]|nr:tetratricopeptide repeat protein [Nannocystis exedens]